MAGLTKEQRAAKDLYLASEEFKETQVAWADLSDEDKSHWIITSEREEQQLDSASQAERIPPKPAGKPELGNKDPEVIAWEERYGRK